MWVADPDLGSGRRQPGGWVHAVLPHLERRDLHEIGHGLPPDEKAAAVARLLASPLEVLHCPSRRGAELYPVAFLPARTPRGSDPVMDVARADYAVNAGDQDRCDLNLFDAPETVEEGLDPAFPWPDVSDHTGVSYLRSEVRMAHIRDGKAHTYLVAEKKLSVGEYYSGVEHGDDWSMYTGYQDDVYRTTFSPPRSDYDEGLGGALCAFGSPHPGTFNAAFCDGSLRAVSFDIDPEVHRRLGNRRDGKTIDDRALR
jgi:prepilin-type processing-associated H-X9-DG protein